LFIPNKVTRESRESIEDVYQRLRPDPVIFFLDQNSFTFSKGFGEVKVAEAMKDTFFLTKDLVRLGVFSKQLINNDDITANLNFRLNTLSTMKIRIQCFEFNSNR
jgi:hypothetical protein